MTFRKIQPSRTVEIAVQNDYKKYREQLRNDFNCRCGYCNDRDFPRAERFEIDHFIPQRIDSSLKTVYSNLVYSCRSCNNSKRDKWPTNNPKQPNDGIKGWIDPCDISYVNQFDRGKYGEIIAKTDLGKWMYDELKLWKPQHAILHCYEEIENALQELKTHLNNIHDEYHLKIIIKLHEKKDDILRKLYI
jgi:hypothetical protein